MMDPKTQAHLIDAWDEIEQGYHRINNGKREEGLDRLDRAIEEIKAALDNEQAPWVRVLPRADRPGRVSAGKGRR